MDLKGYATENHHMAQRQAIGPLDPTQPTYSGYIQDVDIPSNMATVVNPLNSNLDDNLLDPNDPVTPTVSSYMPLPTFCAGLANGQNPIRNDLPPYGMQIVPFGGGASVNPQGGEQVQVGHVNADLGAGAIQAMTFNDMALPPGSQPVPVSGAQLANGEWLFITPAGAIIHLDAQGDVNLFTLPVPGADANASANLRVIIGGGITVQATQNPNLNNPLQNTINLAADSDIIETSGGGIRIQATAAPNPVRPVQYNLDVNADANINIGAGVQVNITATGQVNVAAPEVNVTSPDTQIRGAIIDAGAPGATYSLLTALWYTFLAGHTHTGVTAGADVSGPPLVTPPPTPPYVTLAFEAN
jgi:hypothetical protein